VRFGLSDELLVQRRGTALRAARDPAGRELRDAAQQASENSVWLEALAGVKTQFHYLGKCRGCTRQQELKRLVRLSLEILESTILGKNFA
jgi:hypothetical protein